jgi:hypothetical protein
MPHIRRQSRHSTGTFLYAREPWLVGYAKYVILAALVFNDRT